MKKKVFIITGEPSGDLLAYKVFQNINFEYIEACGILGEKLQNLNIKKIFDNSEITFFGVKDVLLNIFYIKKKINQTVDFIEKFNPDIVFSVDCPDFVFRVIEKIKKNKKINPKFFHYVAPTIWAWRESRAHKIKKLIDKVYLLFDFEKKIFDRYKINNMFVGHPFFENFNYKSDILKNDKLISLCPGSRLSELNKFLPLFEKLINNLGSQFNFHIGITNKHYEYVKKFFKNNTNNITINFDNDLKNEYYQKSIITVAKSGTITLDLCKSQSALITIYKFGFINYLLLKPFIKAKFANIINIMANRLIIPELLQNDCTEKKILNKINFYLNDKSARNKMINDYNQILNRISNKNTSKKIALDLVENLK